ncbi:hypothetical protein [Heyndrickxia camelliae]|uniref:Uncharacterized protein n=1 Tax=Heyndrickxia camelliae TaxID=1707093 RepID=A0A2N3LE56_9BACI|nr:hypothetical protein [Heyndrickxia camelliae]PKR82896.1 hypothetical protein CWO92_22155 [Heyndrickxia camelliae]
MDRTKEELISMGWESIGFDGVLEYLARENEHGEILYIPVFNGKTMGIVNSHNKNVIKLLANYISE